MKYLLLVMLAALLFVLTGCVSAKKAENKAEYTRISQEEAKEMMARDDGHVIVDVRRQDEYDAGAATGRSRRRRSWRPWVIKMSMSSAESTAGRERS